MHSGYSRVIIRVARQPQGHCLSLKGIAGLASRRVGHRLPDEEATTAVLDRLGHHVQIINTSVVAHDQVFVQILTRRRQVLPARRRGTGPTSHTGASIRGV